MNDPAPVPRWQKIAAAAYVAVLAVLVLAFRDRLHDDFWPLDGSRVAPNILATLIQLAVATPVAVLLWPPTRQRLHRFVDRHTAAIHATLEKHHRVAMDVRRTQHDLAMEANHELQRRLDHVIKNHPDIPPLPPKEKP